MAEVRWPRTKGPRNFTGIGEIVVTAGGSGYANPPATAPVVRFDSQKGSGAEATAIVENGRIVRVDVDPEAPGSGYVEPTFVHFDQPGVAVVTGASAIALPGLPMPTTNQVITPWRPGRVIADSPYSQKTQVVDRSSGAWQGVVTIPPTRDKEAAQAVEAMLAALSDEGAWCEIPIGRVGFADYGATYFASNAPNRDRSTALVNGRPNPGYRGIEIRYRGGDPIPGANRTVPAGAFVLDPKDPDSDSVPTPTGRLVQAPKTGHWCRIKGRLYQVARASVSSQARDEVWLTPLPPDAVRGQQFDENNAIVTRGNFISPARTVRGRLASVETPGGKRQGSVWGPWVIRWIEFVDFSSSPLDSRPIPQGQIVDFEMTAGTRRNINLSSAWKSRIEVPGSLTYEKRVVGDAVGLKIVGQVLQVKGLRPGIASVTVWAHATEGDPAEQTFRVQVNPRSDQTIPSIIKQLPAVNVRAGQATERDGSIPFGDEAAQLRYSTESTNPGVARVWNHGAAVNIRGKAPGRCTGRITARNDAGPATYSLPIVVGRIVDESTSIGGPVYGQTPSVPFPDNQNLRFSPQGDADEALVETLSEHFHSPEGLPLTYSARETTTLDEGRSALILPDGDIVGAALTITAPEKAAGDTAQLVRTVEVKASDSKGRSATGTMQITLTDRPNTPPYWSGIPGVNLSPTKLTDTITLTDYSGDRDGDAITYAIKSKPSSSIVTVALNGAVLTVTRVATTEQSGSIVVTATDVDGSNIGVDSSPIPVHVGVGDPPEAPTWADSLQGFPPLYALENPPGFDVKPSVTNNVPGQTASDLTYGVSFSNIRRLRGSIGASTGIMAMRPLKAGNVTITLTATATRNGATASSSKDYRVVVRPTRNNPPVWTGFSEWAVDVAASDTQDLTEVCDDRDGDPITFSLTDRGDAAYATVTLTGGKNLNVTGVKKGTTVVRLSATDATGSRRVVPHSVTVKVNQPVVPPPSGVPTPLEARSIYPGEDETWTGLLEHMPANGRGDEPDWSSATATPDKPNLVQATVSGDSLRVYVLSSAMATNVRVTITAPYPEGRGDISTYVDVTILEPIASPTWDYIGPIVGNPASAPKGVYLPGKVKYAGGNKANLRYSYSVSRSLLQTLLVSGSNSVTIGGKSFAPGYLVANFRGDPPSVLPARTGTTVVTVTATDRTDRRKSGSTNFYIRVVAAGSTNDGDDDDNEDASPGHGDSGGGDG